MSKLIQDFDMRSTDFETAEHTYNHQNCAHTEQAFFSFIEHSLSEDNTFTKKDLPKSVLVNMISYLPICNEGFCLRAINSLISKENRRFKKAFLKRITPKFFKDYDDEYQAILSNKSNYFQEYNKLCKKEDDKLIAEDEGNNKEENKLNYKNAYDNLCKIEDKKIVEFDKLFDDININVLYTSCDLETSKYFDVLKQKNILFQMRQ